MSSYLFGRIVFLALTLTALGQSAPKKITISCGSNGIERDMCIKGTEAWTQKTGIPVEIFSTPNDSNDRLALYQQLLGAKSKDIDVFQIDVVWPGILSSHVADLKTYFPAAEMAEHLPAAVKNNTVAGKLVAVPWFTDGGLLYYRKDLLKKYGKSVPQTWEEMGATAKLIMDKERAAGDKDLQGFVFQGRAYEGLTCNALEWVSSYGAGTVVEEEGRVSINNPNAAKALTLVSSWVGNIAPKGVLSYSEEEARGVFQSGKAVFMRNWPYCWALATSPDSPVKEKVGIAPLPSSGATEGKHASTLGGWGLAISAYSANPKEAADLVRFLTGPEQQKMRSIEASFNPTLLKLYDDPAVLKRNPHLKELKTVFLSAVPRPARQSKSRYNRVSADFWNAAHQVLSGSVPAGDALKVLEARLNTYSNGGKW